MRRVVAAAGLLVALTACFEHPAMTSSDAREFARRALTDVGMRDVRVSPKVEATTYKSADPRFIKDAPVAVWMTTSQVAGGTVVLDVQRRGDNAIYVKDTRADGSGPLLTDKQFNDLNRFRYDPAGDRHRDRARPWAIVAVLLIVAVSAALFLLVINGGRLRRSAT
jgi:hypothetical protein